MLCFPKLSLVHFLFLLPLISESGCSESGPTYGEVTGIVLHGETPVSNIEVRFFPDPNAGMLEGPSSNAVTDENGRFELFTQRTNHKGAITGQHLVIFREIPAQATQQPKPESGGRVDSRIPKEVLEAQKRNSSSATSVTSNRQLGDSRSPTTTPFRGIVVASGHQQFDFDLKSKKWNSKAVE